METLKFKSTIKCTGCLDKVTPHLNKTVGADKWKVDLNDPDRVLTVEADGVTPDQVNNALADAGFSGEIIK
ncbi:MAG: heavy-metal-associated domain-containing protein [Cyclobacteriaceae bacterium]|jgi:copper chaperone